MDSARFPGETEDYRRARNELLRAEIALRRQIESVAAQRRALPVGGQVKTDYAFDSPNGTVRFSELFAPGKDTLYIYNFMYPESPDSFTPCPSCTSIIDAIDGAARHLVQRMNFAVVAKAPIDKFREHASRRGWRFAQLLSSANNTFNRDYQAEEPNGQQSPLAHVFSRRDGKIHHTWSSELWWAEADPGQDKRHVDFMWPMWSVFDRTPEGRGDFYPELEY